MSHLASISVHRCDGVGCTMIAVLQTDQDWDTFEQTWFDGFARHFCPACKGSVQNAAAVAEEESLTEMLRQALRNPARNK